MSRSARVVGGILAVLLAALPGTAGRDDDPLLPYQWGLRAIEAPEAWGFTVGRGVRVAVIEDAGVDYRHPDLGGRVRAIRGNGHVCRPARESCEGTDLFLDAHATMVAGIVGADAGNGMGIAGIAPGVKIISAPTMRHAPPDVAADIRWAIRNGARVINMSFAEKSSYGDYTVFTSEQARAFYEGRLLRALRWAWKEGAVLVASAGNQTLPTCLLPAVESHTICVGAVDGNSVKTWYSNYGNGLAIVAPGGAGQVAKCAGDLWLKPEDDRIVSTASGGIFCGHRGYFAMNGTSFAAPHVSGVAALLLSMGLDNRQAVHCILTTATDLGPPGYDALYGHGLVNALRAVRDCGLPLAS